MTYKEFKDKEYNEQQFEYYNSYLEDQVDCHLNM